MIAYETLCQTILDWREGKKPEMPPPLPGGVVAPPPAPEQEYEEVAAEAYDEESYELTGEAGFDEETPTAYQEGVAPEAEAAQTHQELEASSYEELDTTMEDARDDVALDEVPLEAGVEAEEEAVTEHVVRESTAPVPVVADEFAEGPADRTQAYIPEEYDPAGVGSPGLEVVEQVESAELDISAGDDGDDADDADLALEADVDLEEEVELSADDAVEDATDVDVEEDDGDDFERDYDLEEIDDYATFNPFEDLGAFFRAEFEITQGWEEDAQRHAAFAKYGIRDEQHFYQVTSTMERYFISDDAETRYGGLDGIMQLKLDTTAAMVREDQAALVEGELASDFEPVHGISLQQWAGAQAQIASGADAAPVVEQLGIDDATWQAVSAEWNDRMSRDTTATIATEYGKAFTGAGQGQFGEAGQAASAAMEDGSNPEGDPPISMEQWVEIEVAQSVAYEKGGDAAEVLQGFGMTPADWGMASAWWGQYIARHAMENDGALHKHYGQLREHYEAHYRAE